MKNIYKIFIPFIAGVLLATWYFQFLNPLKMDFDNESEKDLSDGYGKFISFEEGNNMTQKFVKDIDSGWGNYRRLQWSKGVKGWRVHADTLRTLLDSTGYDVQLLLMELAYKEDGSKTMVLTGLTQEVTQTSSQSGQREGWYRVIKFKNSADSSELEMIKKDRSGDDAVVEYVNPCKICP